MINYVYWIYDETCLDPLLSGYIGVTKNVEHRYKSHIRKQRVPNNSSIIILFEGSREDCFNYERTLRPHKKLGWNNAVGGSHGWRLGFEHDVKAKDKMKEAWTEERKKKASTLRKEQNASLIGQKRPKQALAMTGINNPMFGTKRPAYIGEAVSRAHKGKIPVNRQEIYCIGCKERVNMTSLKKYHSKCTGLYYDKL